MFSEHPDLPDSFDNDMQAIRAALTDGQRQQLEEKLNVLGTGLGPRRQDGDLVEGSSPALIVLVSPKVSEEDLDPEDIIPPEITLGDVTVPTDVQETGGIHRPASGNASHKRPSPARTMRVRPLLGGIAAGPDTSSTWGTISAKFYDEDGDAVILTNRHVMGSGTVRTPRNRLLVQPSNTHADDPDTVGDIKQWSDWEVNSTVRNTTDLATIRVADDEAEGIYLGYDRATSTGTTQANLRVTEFSARTGTRSADILATDVQTWIDFGDNSIVRFRGCEYYDMPAIPGSSGSVVGHIDPNTRELTLTGVTFGGTDERTLAQPWRAIEREFGELQPAQEVGADLPTGADPSDPDVTRDPAILTLTIIDSETNDPIEGVTVEANGTSTTSGADGVATLELDSGVWEVTFIAEGYQTGTNVYDLSWGEEMSRTVALLPRETEQPADVTVRVEDSETGDPIEGADVTVTPESESAVVTVRVRDADGNAISGASVTVESDN